MPFGIKKWPWERVILSHLDRNGQLSSLQISQRIQSTFWQCICDRTISFIDAYYKNVSKIFWLDLDVSCHRLNCVQTNGTDFTSAQTNTVEAIQCQALKCLPPRESASRGLKGSINPLATSSMGWAKLLGVGSTGKCANSNHLNHGR